MSPDPWLKLVIKFYGSNIGGVLLAYLLLVISGSVTDEFWRSVLLWHVKPISNLAVNGPLLGYGPNGTPRNEGTPVDLVFMIAGFLAGYVIYPVSIFVIWTIGEKLMSRRA